MISLYIVFLSDAASYYLKTHFNETNENSNLPFGSVWRVCDLRETIVESQLINAASPNSFDAPRYESFAMADDGSPSLSISRFTNNVAKLISSHTYFANEFQIHLVSILGKIVDELNRSRNRCYVASNTIDNRR